MIVIRGNPTDEEVAAVVAVLTAAGRDAGGPPPPARSGWSAYWRSLRSHGHRGPDAWTLSTR